MNKPIRNEGRTLLAVRPPETVSMRAKDGTRLDADVYRPEGGSDHPVLLMRLPYGRKIAGTVAYAHPSWYAANGYIVAVQDVRGRGTSKGTFRVFADDVADGGDAIGWAAKLPGSTGKVGMYGFSYAGHTQLLALAAGRPELAAIAPGMATWDVYENWAYEGGAFALANNVFWGLHMAVEQARLAGDVEAYDALNAAAGALPLGAPIQCKPEVLETYAKYGHYMDWVGNPKPGAYWNAIGVGTALAGKTLDVPMLHVGGWYDYMLTGTLRIYREAVARSSRPQKLLIGPWTHMPWARRVGGTDFGDDSTGEVDALHIAWFDRFLKGVENGIDTEPPVRLFDLLGKKWRDFDCWPEPTPRSFYTTGGPATTSEAGSLVEKTPSRISVDTIACDPRRPVPTMGGHTTDTAGMQERSSVDARAEVMTFTTAQLVEAMVLAGEVELILSVAADQPSFDISAVLSWVVEGRAYNLTQGHKRIDDHKGGEVRIPMRATFASLEPGDRLRLSIAGTSYPAFAVNPGTGAPPAEARQIDRRVITIAVTSGGDAPTRLELPVSGTKWSGAIGFSLKG